MNKIKNIFSGLIVITGLLIHSALLCQPTMVPIRPKPYITGEKLTFALKYGPIHGGDAEIELRQARLNDKTVFHAKVTAKTVGVTEKLYSIKDIFESYFDINSSLPYKAIRNVKEGNYRSYCELIFHHKDTTVYSSKTDSLYKVIPNILDILSSLYYLRSYNPVYFKTGDIIPVVTFWDDEIFPFYLRYKGTEIVKTKYGKMKCHRFDPVVEPGRVFKSEDDLTVWFSADKNFIPVKAKFELIVGTLKCELEQYTNLRYSLTIIE